MDTNVLLETNSSLPLTCLKGNYNKVSNISTTPWREAFMTSQRDSFQNYFNTSVSLVGTCCFKKIYYIKYTIWYIILSILYSLLYNYNFAQHWTLKQFSQPPHRLSCHKWRQYQSLVVPWLQPQHSSHLSVKLNLFSSTETTAGCCWRPSAWFTSL